jgi:hypothetical protein
VRGARSDGESDDSGPGKGESDDDPVKDESKDDWDDDSKWDDDDWDDEGWDESDDESCGVEALVPGAVVHEAKLELTGDGPVFTKVELVSAESAE